MNIRNSSPMSIKYSLCIVLLTGFFLVFSSGTLFATDAGWALRTSNDSEWIDLGQHDQFDLTTGFTFEMWVKTSDQGYFFARQTTNNANRQYSLFNDPSSGEMRVYYSPGSQLLTLSGIAITNNSIWHHVAMTVSGTVVRVYIDGQLVGNGTLSGPISSNPGARTTLMARPQSTTGGSYILQGIVDEVRIYDAALDQGTIVNWMFRSLDISHPFASSVVGYFPMEEGTGSVTANLTDAISGTSHTSVEADLRNMEPDDWVGSDAPIYDTPPFYGDIVINEIMYDSTGAPDIEWIELYNNAGYDIPIGGWVINDAANYPSRGGMVVPGGTMLPSNSYLVLATSDVPQIFTEVICDASGGQGLSFDGNNDWLQFSDSSPFNYSGNATIEFWFKLDNYFDQYSSPAQMFMGKYDSNNNNFHIMLNGTDYNGYDSGAIIVKVDRNGSASYKETYARSWQADTWYHFAYVLDAGNGSNSRIYINGVDVTDHRNNNTGNLGFNAPFYIGAGWSDTYNIPDGNPRYFDGQMDDVRIWKTKLDEATIQEWLYKEIDPTHPNYSSLFTEWRFNDGSGQVATDSSTSGIDAQLGNSGGADFRDPTWTAFPGFSGIDNAGENLTLYTANSGGKIIDGSHGEKFPAIATAGVGQSLEKIYQNDSWSPDTRSWAPSYFAFGVPGNEYVRCTPGGQNWSNIVALNLDIDDYNYDPVNDFYLDGDHYVWKIQFQMTNNNVYVDDQIKGVTSIIDQVASMNWVSYIQAELVFTDLVTMLPDNGGSTWSDPALQVVIYVPVSQYIMGRILTIEFRHDFYPFNAAKSGGMAAESTKREILKSAEFSKQQDKAPRIPWKTPLSVHDSINLRLPPLHPSAHAPKE